MNFGFKKLNIQRLFGELLRLLADQNAIFFILAIAVGCLAALGGHVFTWLIVQVRTFVFHNVNLLDPAQSLPWYIIVFAPAIGGGIVGVIGYWVAEVKGEGVPFIIENVALRSGRIRKRLAVWGAVGSAITLGSGGSTGKEGPIVQIGAALGAIVASFARVSTEKIRTLVACGAAAGIAGIFNAPIGGSLFAAEVILGDFGLTTFSPVILASVAGTVVARSLRGDVRELSVPRYALVHPTELLFYFFLGLLCALVAFIFIRTLYATEEGVLRLKANRKITVLLPLAGGLCVGLIGLKFPQVFGPWTYKTIELATEGKIFFLTAFMLVLAKILATSLTLGTGGSGGVFAPSLFLGSLLGSSMGSMFHNLWPEKTALPGAYAVVGMAALVAATTQAPLTAILILFEMTDSYTMILPLMVACMTSALLLRRLNGGESIYTERLARKGINIRAGRSRNVLQELTVADAMDKQVRTVSETLSLKNLLSILPEVRHVTSFPVVDSEGQLSGIISFSDFQSYVFEESLRDVVIVKDISTKEVNTVFPDDNLEVALQKLGTKDVAHLPVVDRENPRRVVGMVSRRDIVNEHNKTLLRYA